MKTIRTYFQTIILSILPVILITSCTNGNLPATVTPDSQASQQVVQATEEIQAATATQTANQAVFFAPDLPSAQSQEIQGILQSYAAENALDFTQIDSLVIENLNRSKIAFIATEDETWLSIANALPETTFIVASSITFTLPQNAIQIQTSVSDIYFTAGYLSAQLADDWRVGAILPSESIEGTTLTDIFSNGTRYFCGLCSPIYAPVVFFPTVAVINSTADAAAINAAYGEIANNHPNTIFLPSQYLLEDVVVNLRQNGHMLISEMNSDPAKDALMDVGLGFDIANALNEILESKIGAGTAQIKAPILVQDYGSFLSAGKIDYLNIMLSDLSAGFISPYAVPLQ
jgi:hypothetical protein